MIEERWRSVAVGAQAIAIAIALATSCWSSLGPARADDDDESGWSDKISQKFKDTFSGVGKTVGLGKPAPPPEREAPSGCPTITVLPGTEAHRVTVLGAAGNAGVKYQYSLANVGRACSISGGRVSVRVGADGRVLLGPAGAAGKFDVPIRVVIYSELNQKPVESKLFRVPASISAGAAATSFRFLSDYLVIPIAGGRAATDYSIKVGFDTAGGGDAVKTRTGRRHRQKETTESASQ